MSNEIPTEYVNTDFDLRSPTPFDTLHSEVDDSCCVLNYWHEDDAWHACVESNRVASEDDAAADIRWILSALEDLSETAKSELARCDLREFNVGFYCGDTWAYVHRIPADVVRLVAEASCSLAVTLYPVKRHSDGSPSQ